MFPHSNPHTHTVYCDGRDTPEAMVKRALELGFVSLGFSIHGFTPYESDWLSLESEEAYLKEVRRLQEVYADRIEILCGVESDYLCKRDYSAFDYRIDSAHYIPYEGKYLCVDDSTHTSSYFVQHYFGGDYYRFVRAYFEQEAALCAASTADIIGHIDLVSKFNEGGRHYDPCDPRVLGPALEAADCAADRGIPVEMNTGAISRGIRKTPYPHIEILKRLRERNAEIIISGDSHSAQALDTGFDICVELARAAGFDHVLRLRKSGMEEVPLPEV